jgi:putative transposase
LLGLTPAKRGKTMARKLRFHKPGKFYHVIARGNDRARIFFSPTDMCRMRDLLVEGVERYSHVVHAYCFMPNHIHLLIEVHEEPLSKIMHNLTFRYTQYINRKLGRVGHLFQGRYKALILDAKIYYLRLIRYIHLNPVRANIVSDPKDYIWSSHRAYLGMVNEPWIRTDSALRRFSTDRREAIQRFYAFVMKGVGEVNEIYEKGMQGEVLGDKALIEEVQRYQCDEKEEMHIPYEEIENFVCQEYAVSREILISQSRVQPYPEVRACVVYLARKHTEMSYEELGRRLGRSSHGLILLQSRYIQNVDGFKDRVDALGSGLTKFTNSESL